MTKDNSQGKVYLQIYVCVYLYIYIHISTWIYIYIYIYIIENLTSIVLCYFVELILIFMNSLCFRPVIMHLNLKKNRYYSTDILNSLTHFFTIFPFMFSETLEIT